MGMLVTSGVLLAHITDSHVAASGRPTAILKHRSIEILTDLVAQIRERRVDCTLFGGDNIDNRGHGFEDLETFAGLVGGLNRYYCTFGNHEAQAASTGRVTKDHFATRLPGCGMEVGRYSFSEAVGNVRVIGIDTTLVGTSGGYVAPRTMRFLADEIRRAEEDHVVVMGHHLLYRAWEPFMLESWDNEYLVANRTDVITLLASSPKVRAYLCGHHHASRIQRIACRGQTGGFYHILSASPVAFPHTARLLRFSDDGIHVEALRPRISGLVDEGRDAVLLGRKAERYATLGSTRNFLDYVEGRSSDNEVILPYDQAPLAEHLMLRPERRAQAHLS